MIPLTWSSLRRALGIGRESDRELLEMAKAREADFRALAAVLMEAQQRGIARRDASLMMSRTGLLPREWEAFVTNGLWALALEVGESVACGVRRLPPGAFPHRGMDGG